MIYSVLFTAVLALTIIGGLKRIGNVAQRLSPIMGCAYVIMALIIIIFNIGQLPSVLSLIVKSALSTDAMFGAIAGSAISWGIKRGVYANEVGIGTSAITSASAEVRGIPSGKTGTCGRTQRLYRNYFCMYDICDYDADDRML